MAENNFSTEYTNLRLLHTSRYGNSRVFTATNNGKKVIVKTLKQELANDAACRASLREEYETTSMLDNKYIRKALDFVQIEGLGDCIIFEYIEGKSLAEHVRVGTLSEKQVKSVTVFDTDTLEQKVVPIPQLHKRTTLTGTFNELMKADFDDEIKDGYVRLEVTDSYVGIDSIAAFREHYKNLLEVTGKGLERDDARITMTIEELENAGTDPETVFAQYCRDILDEAPGDHLIAMFKDALSEYEKETVEG